MDVATMSTWFAIQIPFALSRHENAAISAFGASSGARSRRLGAEAISEFLYDMRMTLARLVFRQAQPHSQHDSHYLGRR